MNRPAILAVALASLLASVRVLAQQTAPDSAPPKADAPSGKPQAVDSTPRQLSSREAADALGEGELGQIVEILRGNYLHPESLGETALARAGVQGLLDRLGAGARIFTQGEAAQPRASRLMSELLDARTGYIRLGDISPDNIAELDTTLEAFGSKPPTALVLDLRATPHGTDFGLAAQVCQRFIPAGRVLFSIKRPKVNDEQVLVSRAKPKWRGVLAVLVDGTTAGDGEVVAAVLRTHLGAYVIGQQTKGEAAQFEDIPLTSGRVLRVAIGQVTLPDATPVFPGGLAPDLKFVVPRAKTEEMLQLAMQGGSVAPFVKEKARSRMNEAALVAGTNPELDEFQEAQRLKARGQPPAKPVLDEALVRALDYIATVRIFEARQAAGAGRE